MSILPKGYLDMGRAEYAALELGVQRAVYAELREIVCYTMGNENAESAISYCVVGSAATPVAWIMAVKAVECKCRRCKGGGTYRWGACVNGRMSHFAPCARCGGDGTMTFDDMRRGRAYDNHAICRAAR